LRTLAKVSRTLGGADLNHSSSVTSLVGSTVVSVLTTVVLVSTFSSFLDLLARASSWLSVKASRVFLLSSLNNGSLVFSQEQLPTMDSISLVRSSLLSGIGDSPDS